MAFTWNQTDLPILVDPHFIDRVGHFVHANQGDSYRFEMPVMGYQALYYDSDFIAEVIKGSALTSLTTLIHEVRRGAFIRQGEHGWELRFQAAATIRNELDPQTMMPVGSVDYASDLEYSGITLSALDERGLEHFSDWARTNSLMD